MLGRGRARACGASGCEGTERAVEFFAPYQLEPKAYVRSPLFLVLRPIHQLQSDYDRSREPFARALASRSAGAHELDAGARSKCSRVALDVDGVSSYGLMKVES